MTVRFTLVSLGLITVAACAPQVPDSAQGIGFDTYEQQAAREAALSSPTYAPYTVLPPGQTAGFPGQVPPAPGSAEATALETRQILAATRPTSQGQVISSTVDPLQPNTSSSATVLATNDLGISQENNFDAVTGQRTIEGDAALIAQNRAQYQVIPPQELPTRSASTDPNIVQYALQTQHPRGQQIYARGSFSGQNRFERNCASYTSNDQAQMDFLARGGPENDRRGLDPDGDGYACGWDPTPFRNTNGG
jgi:hypothetical protein